MLCHKYWKGYLHPFPLKSRIKMPSKLKLSWKNNYLVCRFWRWAGWFWLCSVLPGRAERNHESVRQLAWLSLQLRLEEEEELGLEWDKTATETIKLFNR